MKTRFTELFGVKYPIMQGGLQAATSPEFTASISNAGALGTINALSYNDMEEYRLALRKTRELTDKPFAVNISMLPELSGEDKTAEYIRIAIEEGVKAFETAGRNPKNYIPYIKEHGAKVVHKCVAVKHALSAQQAGVDAVTMVGYESGGHPGMEDVGLSILVQKAAATLDIPVLAGGGCVDGRGLAAALAWGAEGVLMGTRFYLTKENPAYEAVKQRALAASESETVMIQRSIKNALRVVKNEQALKVIEAEKKGATLKDLMPLISGALSREHMAKGEVEDSIICVGESIGLIDDIPSTKEVVERTVKQAEDIIRHLQTIL